MQSQPFYFSLPRLLAGQPADRPGEGRASEAYVGSSMVFLVTYLYFINLAASLLSGWRMAAAGIVLLFVVWIFWLVILYLNCALIETLRRLGFFRATPNRRVQDFFVGLLLAFFAVQLAIAESWMRWIGLVWLTFTFLNLTAAFWLRFAGRRAVTD